MIVDASVALKWFLDEPMQAEARVLIAREDLKAPDIIVAEILNGFRKAIRDRRITLPLAHEAIGKIDLAIPTIIPSILVAEQALEISIDLKHHINDCIYLAQAIEMDAQMVTADAAFRDVVTGTKWGRHVTLLSGVV